MPELPEVESVRRLMASALVGQRLIDVEVVPDEIVCSGHSTEEVDAALRNRVVSGVHRRGQFFWLTFDSAPVVFGHLGMAGWIREVGADSLRLHSHGEAPLDEESGRPRFLKLLMKAENGRQIAFTDSRRFARIWLGDSAETNYRVKKLGPDAFNEPLPIEVLTRAIQKRKAPLKAILLDQGLMSGIGNWIADEVLYHARINPARLGTSISNDEAKRLYDAIAYVLDLAVNVEADYTRFPENWLFHHRWGGAKGADIIDGREIQRDTVGGRTTAWVPAIQL